MRVVVADTSPLNYLILIDCVDLLRSLYQQIVIPAEVFHGLTVVGAPLLVAGWVGKRPDWVEILSVAPGAALPLAANEEHLDAGELAAIQLAFIGRDSLLLIDEAAGRVEAWHREHRNFGRAAGGGQRRIG